MHPYIYIYQKILVCSVLEVKLGSYQKTESEDAQGTISNSEGLASQSVFEGTESVTVFGPP